MNKPLRILNIIEKKSAVLHSDGLKLFDAIMKAYKPNNELRISFEGLEHCTTAFLNASIGKFLISIGKPADVIKDIIYESVSESTDKKIKQVVEVSLNEKKRIRQNELVREVFCA